MNHSTATKTMKKHFQKNTRCAIVEVHRVFWMLNSVSNKTDGLFQRIPVLKTERLHFSLEKSLRCMQGLWANSLYPVGRGCQQMLSTLYVRSLGRCSLPCRQGPSAGVLYPVCRNRRQTLSPLIQVLSTLYQGTIGKCSLHCRQGPSAKHTTLLSMF